MGVPSSGEIRETVLGCLKDGAVLSKAELASLVADSIRLPEADRALTKGDGEPLIESRVWHAADSLVKAGFLDRDRGRHKITSAGLIELRDSCPTLRGSRPVIRSTSTDGLDTAPSQLPAEWTRHSSPWR